MQPAWSQPSLSMTKPSPRPETHGPTTTRLNTFSCYKATTVQRLNSQKCKARAYALYFPNIFFLSLAPDYGFLSQNPRFCVGLADFFMVLKSIAGIDYQQHYKIPTNNFDKRKAKA